MTVEHRKAWTLAVVALVLLVVLAGAAARPFQHDEPAVPKPHTRLGPILPENFAIFVCEVCQAFCIEFEKTVGAKATDDDWMLAVQWARGNTSNYGWENSTKRLRAPETRAGVPAIDAVYDVLDHALLDQYSVEITLHALHATAHRQSPVKVNWGFSRQVWCVEEEGVCEPRDEHADPHAFGVLRHDFDHFRRIMEHQNTYLDPSLTPKKTHSFSEVPHVPLTELPPEDPAHRSAEELHHHDGFTHDEM